ncbi:MAG: portal protein [Deltaproteobacteria bacterium]|nr:MAG: portal protein [Deltaproteobacteria bacterium]
MGTTQRCLAGSPPPRRCDHPADPGDGAGEALPSRRAWLSLPAVRAVRVPLPGFRGPSLQAHPGSCVGEGQLLQVLGLMVVLSGVLLVAARKLAIPSIILFIAAGLILGPITGLVDLSSALSHDHADGTEAAIAIIAELGIALLLFLVGLELSLDRIRDVGKVAVAAGIGQVVFTAAIGFVLAMLLGFTTVESFFLATALTFSSTVVVVKLLDQKKDVHALYGRIAVGIFLVQDLVVIVALTFLAGLGATGGEAAGMGVILRDLGIAFAGMAAMLVVALVASRWVLPRPFAWAARSPETLFIWSLCWCFAFVLGAELMSLSPEIGAFLAGVSLAQLGCAHDLRRRVQPLMNFFIAVFFVTLGAQMQLGEASEQLLPALVLALFVLIGNPFIFMIIIARFGYSEETSFKTSVTVAQISEFSFIFAAMGLAAGLIDDSILAIVALVGLVTIVISAYMILYNDALYALVRRTGVLKLFRASQTPDDAPAGAREGHVVIIGMNTLGRSLVSAMHDRGLQVLAIDTDPQKLRELPCATMLGNVEFLPVLEEADFRTARIVISALQIEDTNNLVAYHCDRADVACAIHAFDSAVTTELADLGVDYLIDSKRAGIGRMRERLTALEVRT